MHEPIREYVIGLANGSRVGLMRRRVCQAGELCEVNRALRSIVKRNRRLNLAAIHLAKELQ
jgi:hypothetical protein